MARITSKYNSQSNFKDFVSALERGKIDLKSYYSLELDERTSADNLLFQKGYISQNGDWTIVTQRGGIFNLMPRIDGEAGRFVKKKTAESFAQYQNSQRGLNENQLVVSRVSKKGIEKII